jgi:hypothetical protein
MNRPSSDQAKVAIRSRCFTSCSWVLLIVSQMQTLQSSPADANRCPSRDHVSFRMPSWCPFRVNRCVIKLACSCSRGVREGSGCIGKLSYHQPALGTSTSQCSRAAMLHSAVTDTEVSRRAKPNQFIVYGLQADAPCQEVIL